MLEAVKIALVPVCVWFGWHLSMRAGERARRAVRNGVVIVGLLWAAAVASGLARDSEFGATHHRWIGHILFMAVWLLTPVSAGLLIQRRSNPFAAIVGAALVAGIVFLSEWTGYLGPSHGDVRSQETINRFVIMHQVTLPSLTGAIIGLWYYLLRPKQSGSVFQPDRDASGH